MIILPYIHKTNTVNRIVVHSYTILTIGGVQLWEESAIESIVDLLEANDLYADSIQKYNDIYLCSIDLQKTHIAEFYKWSEITETDTETFCWRTLFTFGEQQNWLPHPDEVIGGYSYQAICDMITNNI